MIWPLRRKRRVPPAAAPDPAPGAGVPAPQPAAPGRGAWRRAEPLRPTATTPAGAPTVAPALLVTGGARALSGPPALGAGSGVLRPVGMVRGLAAPQARPARPAAAEPPLRAPSPLPSPFPARRGRRTAPVVPGGAEQGSLTRADERYVSAPRAAAPVEPAPPWMRGEVPGMTPDEVAALFPGFTGLPSHPGPPASAPAPSSAPAGEPAGRGRSSRPALPPRPSLAESRRRTSVPQPAPETGPDALTHPTPTAPSNPEPPARTAAEAPDPAGPVTAPDVPASADAPPATPAPADVPPTTPAPPAPETPAPSHASPVTAPAEVAPAPSPAPPVGPADAPSVPRGDGRVPTPPGPPTTHRPLGLRPPLEGGAGRGEAVRPALPHAPSPRSGPAVTPGTTPSRREEDARPQEPASGGPAPPAPRGTAPKPPASAVVPRDLAAAFARLYGVDVSAVPVHRGKAASERAARLSARAFTEGGAVFLPEEAGSLESGRGRGLLAHELTHAVQQDRHGAALPAEDTAAGLGMEIEALIAERYFRGDPGAPEPAPAAPEPTQASCDHTDAPAPVTRSVSWTPDTGMVTSGVQRASADEITQSFLDELNELRKELGQGGRVSAISELTQEERIRLELRLRKAGVTDGDEEEEAEARPLDWAEFFAQAASTLSADLIRPFSSRDAREQREDRDRWRAWAEDRGLGTADIDRGFLDDDDDDDDGYGTGLGTPSEDADLPAAGADGEAAARSTPHGPVDIGPDDADLVRPLYRHLVRLLEEDGLLPAGSAVHASGPTDWTAPAAAAAGAPVAAAGPADPGARAGAVAVSGADPLPAEANTSQGGGALASGAPEAGPVAPGGVDAAGGTSPLLVAGRTPAPAVTTAAVSPAGAAEPVAPPVGAVEPVAPPADASGSTVLAALYPGLVARLRKDGHLPAAGAAVARSAPSLAKGASASVTAAGSAGAGLSTKKATKAGQEKKAKEAERPLDYAEWFAQSASQLKADLLRPFSSNEAQDDTEHEEWRAYWQQRFGGESHRSYDRSFLEDEDEEDEEEAAIGRPASAVPSSPAAARTAGARTVRTARTGATPKAPAPTASAAAPAADAGPAPMAVPAAVPVPDAVTPELLSALVEDWDDVSLRQLSERLFPLLVDDLRRDLLTGHERHGFT
ncbi:DUF4157 domain-containing protein [Streptomyces sp. NPDC056519]|uniref:eCIS core domain-containing protein n=1 Tax=Streptomyces sp. NPDC056519 TaxID=3345849 RepID=UPI0036739EFC